MTGEESAEPGRAAPPASTLDASPAEPERAAGEVAARAQRHAAIANLGLAALAGAALKALIDQAVAAIARTLDVELCQVLELLPDGRELELRAGVGFRDGCVGCVRVGAGADSQAGYTLVSSRPVIVDDLRTETRFGPSPLLVEHGAVSGVSVVIPGHGFARPFGVLAAHTTCRRAFTRDDVHFLQAAANVLASAIDRKLGEERLRASEEKFRQLADAVPAVLWVSNVECTRVFYVSRAFEEIWGRARDLLQKSPLAAREAVYPDDRDRVATALAPPIRSPREAVYRIVRPDGTLRWIRNRALPIRDEDGGITRCAGIAEDITDVVRAERHMAAQHALSLALAQASSFEVAAPRLLRALCTHLEWDAGALWAVEPTGVALVCVDTWHEPTVHAAAFARETRQGRYPRDVDAPGRAWGRGRHIWLDDRTFSAEAYTRAPVATRCGLHAALFYPVRSGDSVLGVLELLRRDARAPDEDLLRVLGGIASQIGQFMERMDAEERLRQAEARKVALLEAAFDCIVSAGADGRIVEFNKAAEQTFGWRAAEVIGRPLVLVLVPPALRQRHLVGFERAVRLGVSALHGKPLETTGLRRDGTEFPIELVISQPTAGPQVMTAYLRDLTERRRAEEARLAAVEQLRRAERLATVGTLAAGIAHELGTPLHVVLTYAKMIASGEAQGGEVARGAGVIAEQAERMTRIIGRILDFARPRPPEKALADVAAIARAALGVLAPLAERRGVTLEFAQGPGSAAATVDVGQLQQVLVNLVMNAIQASARGARVAVEVGEARARRPGAGAEPAEHVRVDVRDEGEGMQPERLARLFEPFFTTKPAGEGVGLGLSVSHGIVREHGGWIQVESEVGKGSRFTVHLPR